MGAAKQYGVRPLRSFQDVRKITPGRPLYDIAFQPALFCQGDKEGTGPAQDLCPGIEPVYGLGIGSAADRGFRSQDSYAA